MASPRPWPFDDDRPSGSVRPLSQADLQAILAHLEDDPDQLLAGTGADRPVVAMRVRASVGRPGGSAHAQWRRLRAAEWATWTRTLPWRAAATLGIAVGGGVLGRLVARPGSAWWLACLPDPLSPQAHVRTSLRVAVAWNGATAILLSDRIGAYASVHQSRLLEHLAQEAMSMDNPQLPSPTPSTADSADSAGDFGAAFKGFLERTVAAAPVAEPVFAARLRAHFGTDPAALPIVAEQFEPSEHPNLQAALDAWLQPSERSFEAIGVTSEYKRFNGLGLADILTSGRTGLVGGSGPAVGPVEYINVALDRDRVMTCLQFGLLLIGDGGLALAVLVSGPTERGIRDKGQVEVMAADRDQARGFLADLRAGMHERNVYRGHVVSLAQEPYGSMRVKFHALPTIAREDIVLADGVLERVERHTVGFATHRDRLLRAGRHLRRGLLLHGQPGTGKTLTAMYLAGRMGERTVVLLTGREIGLIPRACAMARMLQPSMVILEDVDLIAEERDRQQPGCTPLLFELLNEMDGLGDDADVIFLLTSNRPDLLEPALAARPGRVDLAVEVPLPDASCRRRLFELYGHGLTLGLDADGLDRLVQRTEGVSPAFIRELLRKAALLAVLPTGGSGDGDGVTAAIVVTDQHLDQAMHELVLDGGELTRRLLGAIG